MMRHIKKFTALLLAAICTMMVLTGCVDKASLYDDTQQIAAGKTAYSTTCLLYTSPSPRDCS